MGITRKGAGGVLAPLGSALDDAGIVAGVAGRDEAALREAVRRHGDQAHGLALWFVPEADAAVLIAQEAFVELWKDPEGAAAEATLSSFLMQVVRAKAAEHLRATYASRLRSRNS